MFLVSVPLYLYERSGGGRWSQKYDSEQEARTAHAQIEHYRLTGKKTADTAWVENMESNENGHISGPATLQLKIRLTTLVDLP